MEKLVEKGLVKSIGISNFNIHRTEKLLKEAKIKPVAGMFPCFLFLMRSCRPLTFGNRPSRAFYPVPSARARCLPQVQGHSPPGLLSSWRYRQEQPP